MTGGPFLLALAASYHGVLDAPCALSTQAGAPLAGTRRVEVRGGVAILSIVGPIVRRTSPLASLFGSLLSQPCDLGDLAIDFNAALRDPNVRAILLSFDSPGGAVTGVSELGDMVYAARATKPIASYVGGSCESAAYWLASAAGRLVISATALVGSIGVLAKVDVPEPGKATPIVIVNSQSPKKALDPRTESGRASLQSQVDALAGAFIEDVARNRGVTPAKVEKDFGAGGTLVGRQAVTAGLADALGSFEGVLADLQRETARPGDGAPSGASARLTQASADNPSSSDLDTWAEAVLRQRQAGHAPIDALGGGERITASSGGSAPSASADATRILRAFGVTPEQVAAGGSSPTSSSSRSSSSSWPSLPASAGTASELERLLRTKDAASILRAFGVTAEQVAASNARRSTA